MAKMITCKVCGKEIAKSASTCPHCGAKRKKHFALGVIAAILAIAVIGSVLGEESPTAEKEPTEPVGSTSSADISAEAPAESSLLLKKRVTKDEFDRVESGMTYEEVVEIIGFDGELNSQVDIGAGSQYKTEIYTWSNALGSNMNVTFQGGKVVSKAQFGLT